MAKRSLLSERPSYVCSPPEHISYPRSTRSWEVHNAIDCLPI